MRILPASCLKSKGSTLMLRPPTISRRHFPRTLTSLLPALGFAGFASSPNAGVPDTQGISHTAEAIHQEVVIKANRKRVYEALTDEGQFRRSEEHTSELQSRQYLVCRLLLEKKKLKLLI